jgi:alkylation response protein AidB-like acyl-CoA dehydrogenase
MAFDLTDDQLALRDGIRALVGGRFPIDAVRRGFDRAGFDELAAAGVFSLRADGFTWADAVIVYEELGRALVPGPLVWSFGEDGVVTGFDTSRGGAPLVEHAGDADAVLVLGPTEVWRVATADLEIGDPDGWPLDPLTPVWRLDGIGDAPGATAAGDPVAVRSERALLAAAYCVGMADRLVELAVDYAQERRQFDRPIGSFQAVKHICAEMAVRVELARVAVHAAACMLDDPSSGVASRAVSGAKLLAGEAAVLNGRAATQVFGGMGFTWEVDVHLYLKRAWLLDGAFGAGDHHADAVAATMAAPAG